MARKKSSKTSGSSPRETDRIGNRELRNTPGWAWEHLAKDEPLALVAEGEAKAVVIPLVDGDAATALEAYRRGRAMMAVARLRTGARQSGASKLGVDQINELIAKVRAERGRQHRGR